jgi:hypothetical protein
MRNHLTFDSREQTEQDKLTERPARVPTVGEKPARPDGAPPPALKAPATLFSAEGQSAVSKAEKPIARQAGRPFFPNRPQSPQIDNRVSDKRSSLRQMTIATRITAEPSHETTSRSRPTTLRSRITAIQSR